MEATKIHIRKQVVGGKDRIVVSDNGGTFEDGSYRIYGNAVDEARYRKRQYQEKERQKPIDDEHSVEIIDECP